MLDKHGGREQLERLIYNCDHNINMDCNDTCQESVKLMLLSVSYWCL